MKGFSRIQRLLWRGGITIAAVLPMSSAVAQAPSNPVGIKLNVCWGGIPCIPPATLFTTMNDAFFYIAALIALAIFLIGAFRMTISAGRETEIQAGKTAMIGSLVGLALVTASFGIYRTVVYWLYS